jgi:hypothetical protein
MNEINKSELRCISGDVTIIGFFRMFDLYDATKAFIEKFF